MFYERPRLITLSGKAWDATGNCMTGISNPLGDCTVGVHATDAACNTGNGPSPTKPCNTGATATASCNSFGSYASNLPNPSVACSGGLFAHVGCSGGGGVTLT
jgi:hypothetical protein